MDFTGCKKIFPRIVLFSISCCVVVLESITTLNLSRPCCCWIRTKIGLTRAEKAARVDSLFGSKRIELATTRTFLLMSISNRLTFTLSNADFPWSIVFCPQTTIPSYAEFAKDVIGLMSWTCNVSRSSSCGSCNGCM